MTDNDFVRYAVRYVIGFVAALCLSFASYLVATIGWLESATLTMAALLSLAVVQLVVQLVYFLHLNFHGRARARSLTLGVTLVMMMVVVIGSLWIMQNLDYRMGMSPEAMNEYMEAQNKKGF